MRLIESDAEDFGNILGLIDDYEGRTILLPALLSGHS